MQAIGCSKTICDGSSMSLFGFEDGRKKTSIKLEAKKFIEEYYESIQQ